MVCLGDGDKQTAMAKTVGLPVAIAALKILNGEITDTGVQIPIKASIYKPILEELATHGIRFRESEKPYLGYNDLNL
jgi:saccharopine dehydrogenase (NAD+, L-glutamate forming)